MGWGRRATYSHASRLLGAGWLERCERTRGQGSLVYASRAGVRACRTKAAPVPRDPSPVSWPHCDASAWTAAWLTARRRGMVGSREMLLKHEWYGDLRWRVRGETRERRHRPDLAGQLPDGRLLPIEVELIQKSAAGLRAVLSLHAEWVMSGRSPAVMYVCDGQGLAELVGTLGEEVGLSVERGTLRIELIQTIQEEAIKARKLGSARSPERVEVAA